MQSYLSATHARVASLTHSKTGATLLGPLRTLRFIVIASPGWRTPATTPFALSHGGIPPWLPIRPPMDLVAVFRHLASADRRCERCLVSRNGSALATRIASQCGVDIPSCLVVVCRRDPALSHAPLDRRYGHTLHIMKLK